MADFGGFASDFGPGTAPAQPPAPPFTLNPAISPIVLQQFGALSSIYLETALGTQAAPTPILANFGIGQLVARGFDGTAYGSYDAALYFRATQNHTPTAHGAEIIFFTTPNGATAAATNAGVTQGGALWCGGPGVLPTNATDAFFGMPTMAGAPTGVPVINYSTAPMVYDTTDKQLWVYSGGWKAFSGNAGTITAVNPGTGLTGGGVSGAVTLSLATPVAVANGGTGVTTSTGSGANVLGTSPTLATPTINTTLTLTSAAASTFTVDAPAGNQRVIQFTSAGSSRWLFFATAGAESGGNAGSNLTLSAYSDAGAFLSNPIIVTRSTGLVSMATGLSVTGGGLAITGLTAHGVIVAQAGGTPVASTAAGAVGAVLTGQGAAADPTFTTAAGGSVLGNPTPPVPTNTGTMMGMGASTFPCVFTPTRNGRVLVMFIGVVNIPASSPAGSGLILNLFYGTGTPPAAGAAQTGTSIGASSGIRAALGSVGASILDQRPFTACGFLTGLTVGVQYWCDLFQTQAVASGTAGALNVQFTFMEQ